LTGTSRLPTPDEITMAMRLAIDGVPGVGTKATVIFPKERLPDMQILSNVP
jgi:hypothetical protein